MEGINIREINPADAEEIHRIDSICFPPDIAYSLPGFLSLLNHINEPGVSNIKGYIAETGSGTAGFIIARQPEHRRGRPTEIITIDILPEFRKKGYGEKLLRFMENHLLNNRCRYIYLEVAENNDPALKLYKKLGYKIAEKINAYYPGNIAAFLMIKRF
ncbi:MAG: hypothetical protein DRP57_02530 [Spirochaetes bacterium]|nr:MAG: hypothetical protein DRP57_02530 [Spirochaetota bacterium]